jgi:hypothetical protein
MKSSDIINMKKVVFVLKKAPGSVVLYDNYCDYGTGIYDPMWSVLRGYKICKRIRFTGFIGKYKYMDVMCLDITTELRGNHMVWKVSNDCQEIRCLGGHRHRNPLQHKQMNDTINVIRLRLYWVLRGIVGFKRLLARARIRAKRRKIFIQATYWGHPKCTLSCFSGTINTPVKQRIHAFI